MPIIAGTDDYHLSQDNNMYKLFVERKLPF